MHTPPAYGSGTFNLQLKSKPVQGPSGPHLFRASIDASSVGKSEDYEWQYQLAFSPVSPQDATTPMFFPQGRRASEPNRVSEIPPPRTASRISSHRLSPQQLQQQDSVASAIVREWTPTQVAEWMYECGVEDNLVESFIQNDISGSVLLDLHIEDLKELDIQSFGKRHHLMTLIQDLRSADFAPVLNSSIPTEPPTSPPPQQQQYQQQQQFSFDAPTQRLETKQCDTQSPDSPKRRGRRNRVIKEQDVISPAESVSIVAIEQLLPKPHKCSKGENCPKFQRRQQKLARIAKEFPNEFPQVYESLAVSKPHQPHQSRQSHQPHHLQQLPPLQPPQPMESVLRPSSDAAPSLVASSDVLGPGQIPELKLNEENLNGVQPRDPQENVRQFLNFQHLHNPEQAEAAPVKALQPQADANVASDNMASQLRTLPKLMIPGQSPIDRAVSPQRTITPSMGTRAIDSAIESATVTQEHNPFNFAPDSYRHGTPFSEMDVPITAVPVEPLARENSQSVPPDMRFGNLLPLRDPVSRPRSARPDHRRRPSFTAMAPLNEDEPLSPINHPADLESTYRPQFQPPNRPHSRAESTSSIATSTFIPPQFTTSLSSCPSSTDPDVTHSGWMKKRKTTRLLRHEWQDAHFTLNGTILAMHKDEQESQRRSRALESIDVDDYAVACSSLASNSKLTAAFKRSLLRKAANVSTNGSSYKGLDETAFAFSLVPAGKEAEKKPLFSASGKSHHFAVKSRDERINWMRELMLAKALKKGKDNGNEIRMNGNVI